MPMFVVFKSVIYVAGETPQRRIMDYPRTLKATSPHERILERYRTTQQQRRVPSKCSSVDSLLVNIQLYR